MTEWPKSDPKSRPYTQSTSTWARSDRKLTPELYKRSLTCIGQNECFFENWPSHTKGDSKVIPKWSKEPLIAQSDPKVTKKCPQSDPKVGKVTPKASQSNPKGIYKIIKIRWKNVYFGRREGSWRHMCASYAHIDPKVITKWPKRHKFWHFMLKLCVFPFWPLWC